MNEPQQATLTTNFKRLSMQLIRAVIAIAILASTASARADLISPVTVALIAPGGITGDSTPIDVADTVATVDGISPGDGTDIGDNWMLSTEYIVFSGNSIRVRVAAGADDGAGNLTSGYLGLGAEHARYLFTGLGILNATIVGFTATATGIATPSTNDFIHLLSASSLSIDLDSLIFVAPPPGTGSAEAGGNIVINLLTSDNPTTVPEPASLGIVLIGMASLGLARRRTARVASRKSND